MAQQLSLIDVAPPLALDYRRLAIIRFLLLWAASDPSLNVVDVRKLLERTGRKEDVEPQIEQFFAAYFEQSDGIYGMYQTAVDNLEDYFKLAQG